VDKMVETKIVTGHLSYDQGPDDAHERWTLFDTIKWNTVDAEVTAYLDDILDDFDGAMVEITIKKVEQ